MSSAGGDAGHFYPFTHSWSLTHKPFSLESYPDSPNCPVLLKFSVPLWHSTNLMGYAMCFSLCDDLRDVFFPADWEQGLLSVYVHCFIPSACHSVWNILGAQEMLMYEWWNKQTSIYWVPAIFQILLSDGNTPIKRVLSSRSLSSHERHKLPHSMVRTAIEI